MSIAIGTSYLYMSEIFPSVFRGICVGVVVFIGRLGAVLSPLIANTLISLDLQPFIALGVTSFIALLVNLVAK